MLAMRRESDNLNNSSNNTPHSSYTASNLSGDNNLTHLNYPHPVHSYSTSAGYSGYQTSKLNQSPVSILMKTFLRTSSKVTAQIQPH